MMIKEQFNTQVVNNQPKTLLKFFALAFFLKLILLIFFSSEYQNGLFVPFIRHFLTDLNNPWQYFFKTQVDKFPYPPLMLYIVSLFYLPCHLLFNSGIIVQNIFFKLPILLSDLLITYILFKLFPRKIKEILLFYFLSPIVIYASYMNSQLDLIAISILIYSLYLLVTNKLFISSVVFGLAISTKLHLILVLPLVLIYVFKKFRIQQVLYFIFVPIAVYSTISFPYIFSEGYSYMVLRNPKQMAVFDSFYPIGDLKIYIPIFCALAIYAKFFSYRKVNKELFYSFIGILFLVFVFLIFPAYSWYVWMVPFLSLFFIEYYARHPRIAYLYLAMNALYLIFFIFFYAPQYQDLIFLKVHLYTKIPDERLKNITFTAFELILSATVFSMYKFGVRSNSIYKRLHSFIIGIGGDSAAGKNTLLSDIRLLLNKRLLELEGDADHRWERSDENWQKFTHLHPKANYLHKQAQDLFALKYGESIFRSSYNHATGSFTEENKIRPNEFIILTGLHTFYLPITRKIIDLKIYLDTEEKLRRHWKLLRDTRERGYPADQVLEQIERRVLDAKKYIHPQKEFADLIISYFTSNEFDAGEPDTAIGLKLRLTLDSSIHLESLYRKLMLEEVDVCWDYADDLNRQYLILSSPPDKKTVINIAKDIIPNIDEIITAEAVWLDGYRGFVQLVVILVMSEKMREKEEYV